MSRLRSLIILAAAALFHLSPATAAEPIVGAPEPSPRQLDPAARIAANRYFYVDFPRRLQSLDNEIQLAEADLALITRRFEQYRPMRSFHQYGATYTADFSWQIAFRDAQYRHECLRQAQADLWSERQQMAALLVAK